jgi:hypothetical protein
MLTKRSTPHRLRTGVFIRIWSRHVPKDDLSGASGAVQREIALLLRELLQLCRRLWVAGMLLEQLLEDGLRFLAVALDGVDSREI